MRTSGRLVNFIGIVLLLTAAFMTAPPAVEAYDVILTQWNTSELEAAGDTVTVSISGNTITFTWNDGNGVGPTATNLDTIYWSSDVSAQGSPTANPTIYKVQCSDGTCNADGFGNFAFQEVTTANNKTLTVTFTFAGNLPGDLTASDFALHVQYDSSCSGFVGGPNVAAPSNANCSATVVPEPLTVFLGGTGLLAMGYLGRKRLFQRFAR